MSDVNLSKSQPYTQRETLRGKLQCPHCGKRISVRTEIREIH